MATKQTSNIDILGESGSDDDDLLMGDNEEIDMDNLPKTIMNLTLSIDKRLEALEIYYEKVGDNALEIISGLSGMYQLSGSTVIEQFLHKCCTHGQLSSFIKLECAKSLLSFEEIEDDSDSEDDEIKIEIKTENNVAIRERNAKRQKNGYKSLDFTCYDLDTMPTPCRVEAICMLMACRDYRANADMYFREFITDTRIECEYRYKTILSLERKNNIVEPKFFMCNACNEFLFDSNNMTYYRTLSAQYLLQDCADLGADIRLKVENKIYEFASDNELDYDRRADAADLLLKLASPDMKNKGKEIILELGRIDGNVRTVFDNAQNVHTETVEESVSEALEFLSSLPMLKIDKKPIEFEYVNNQIEAMLKKDKDYWIDNKIDLYPVENKKCLYCDCATSMSNMSDEKSFCNVDRPCVDKYDRDEKVHIALNRIFMDRVLYSKFNNTLVNILLKVWTYMFDHDAKNEMEKRLLEELVEMSGTCSTGFATRLINVISAFGDFNIRISWEEQIAGNFAGRLNARARTIVSSESPYYNERSRDVVELWLNNEESESLKKSIVDKLGVTIEKKDIDVVGIKCFRGDIEKSVPMHDIIDEFLSTDRDEKIQKCVEDFSERVLNEMMVKTSDWANRRNFLLFFRTNMSSLREELFEEFKDFVEPDDFDLYFRKAIIHYEGES